MGSINFDPFQQWDYILQAFPIVACMIVTSSDDAHAWELQKLMVCLTSLHSSLLIFSLFASHAHLTAEAKCTSQGPGTKLNSTQMRLI